VKITNLLTSDQSESSTGTKRARMGGVKTPPRNELRDVSGSGHSEANHLHYRQHDFDILLVWRAGQYSLRRNKEWKNEQPNERVEFKIEKELFVFDGR